MIGLKLHTNISESTGTLEIQEKFLPDVVKYIKEDIERNISGERAVTADIGGTYTAPKPLSRSYLMWKIRTGRPSNIYQKERVLIKSITSKKNGALSYKIFVTGDANDYAEYVNRTRRFFAVSQPLINFIQEKFKTQKVA